MSITDATPVLDLAAQLRGREILVFGGTGFLGKVWVSMMLHRFPDIGHIWLIVRPKGGGEPREASRQRFWLEVAAAPPFDPLRADHGEGFEAFIKDRITPIPGDVKKPMGGIPDEVRDAMRGRVEVLCNVAGVVDFNPPLDHSLETNAFGMQNLVGLAKDLGGKGQGGIKFFHTSTCYVAGDRTGEVHEVDPRAFPFPRAKELGTQDWDPEREIAECVDLVESVRHRANDAFRQTDFLDQARRNLKARQEPARGRALADELAKVKRKYEEQQLVEAGQERAHYWGWHNIYTYTKSLGEQILASSGLTFTIGRPAVIESALQYPEVGWNEGINTSAPLIYMAMQGPVRYASSKDAVLDVIPVDHVAAGMTLTLGELLEDSHKPVYQYGSSDTSPLEVERLIELVSLFKRKHFRTKGGGNPVVNFLQSRAEAIGLSVDDYPAKGPGVRAKQVKGVAGMLRSLGGPLAPVTKPAARQLEGLSKGLEIQGRIADVFLPFMATHSYRFSCANTRAAYDRLSDEERAMIPWEPETIDWREYLLEVHCPGLERRVVPLIEEKLQREDKPLRQHDDMVAFVDELASRHDLAPALLRTHEDGFTRVSFRELRGRSMAVAVRLAAAGVEKGDRVILSGANHPDWPIAWFGIVRAGGVAVPLDPGLDPAGAALIAEQSGARLAILDATAREAFGGVLGPEELDLHEVSALGAVGRVPVVGLEPDDLAAILYTSGTTGSPKGVMLTHGNFTAMLSSLGKTFRLRDSDRVLSVLPLHHAFEFSCGLLLPLSMGARVYYLDKIDADRLSYGLREGRITAMVGVPALWQLLERRIKAQVRERGKVFQLAFDAALELNRLAGRKVGLDFGPLFFGSVHSRFGGQIRMLISGGAALPSGTQSLFQGLGLPMAEGYGLTEAAPVLTAARPRVGARSGTVGTPVPGVKVQVRNADDSGVGEVWAKGPNVMKGYFGNPEATAAVLDAEGWLKTGDMGRLDHKGRLILSGRAKDVVVTASGENIYLDDVEQKLGQVPHVDELALVGLPDGKGGERLGLLAVVALPLAASDDHDPGAHARAHASARGALKDAVAALPQGQRPAVVHLVDAPLPRTATRKIKRAEVRSVLERIVAAAPKRGARAGGVGEPVSRAVAAVAGVALHEVGPGTSLQADLGFDSLMWVELAAALDELAEGRLDADALSRCETVAEVVKLVGAPPQLEDTEGSEAKAPFRFPEPAVPLLRGALTFAQSTFNGKVLQPRVTGRAHIPQNRPTLVISNHSSHLDMGLVKLGLGRYGEKLSALAAQDYFFEGNELKAAYFDQLTNVKPLDRRRGFRRSMEQAKEVLDAGNTVLIFPEGTRSVDGSIQEFKPMVGLLALEAEVDILPVYLEGCYEALPKGAAFLRSRRVGVHIGPPLRIEDARRLTAGMKRSKAARRLTDYAYQAVTALRDGGVFDLAQVEDGAEAPEPAKPKSVEELLADVFEVLPGRYDAERIDKPLSWYFSMGGNRYTVSVDKAGCTIKPGRPTGAADCVIKTTPEMVRKMVQDKYVPTPAEFMSGDIKTNDIPLLIEFARVFDLGEVSFG